MWHWFEKTRVLFSPGVTAAHIEMYDFRWHLVTFNIWDWCALKSFFPIKVIDSCIYILLNINKSNACWSWPYKVNFLVTFSKITWRNNSVFVYIQTPQLVRCQMPTKCTAAKFFCIWYWVKIAFARSWRFFCFAEWRHRDHVGRLRLDVIDTSEN